METIVLQNIPFELSPQLLAQLLRIKIEDVDDEFRKLVEHARLIGKPKALYKAAFVESRSDDQVVIEGIAFQSRVLQVNLQEAHRVFPFIATCGTELEKWADAIEDNLHRFWAEAIMGMALLSAIKSLDADIRERYGVKKISHMAPGSLTDWPLEQQAPLFRLLGDTRTVDVELLETFFMSPTKTVSGIRFPTEVDFENCMLCPRDGCPGRRAKYDKDMYDKKYRKI